MPLRKIRQEQYFKCFNGAVLQSMKDLKEELERNVRGGNMENFSHHATPERNDYADWVQYVFGEKQVADNMRAAKNPGEMLQAMKPSVALKKPVPPRKEKTPRKKEEPKKNLMEASEELLERTTKMKKNIVSGTPEGIKDKAGVLREKYEALRQKISEERKNGNSMLMPSLLVKNVKPKIDYFEITGDESDYKKAEALLGEISNEIKEELSHKEPDLKAEVLKAAGMAPEKNEDED